MGSSQTSSSRARAQRLLGLDGGDTYECPVCRHGQIQPMALMDAYACSFCRHIFEVNLEQQTVHVVDSVQPMGWRWQGWRWQPLYQSRGDITLTLWLIGLALVILPAGIVALGGYIFPPLEATAGMNWSMVWALGTLAAHSAMVGWLIAEHHQFPIYVMAKIRLQRLLERLPG
ncbi:hypothetical protein VB780_10205 [Leptolyngbya sp. CCNP1308]|uniref:hypothetical protein n=1 Tax=Leptolyngbya sp. CCNP1308 TaxID=3110255 RepID=UPI002B21A326|nr:hypothetical protein [Leptolyngbya sp. CCNP1308]MEA5448941.1 hypothetical protein [Leptolyngbya sp. CCNP1308]